MTQSQNVWIQNHNKSICSLHELSFPNQFDARKLINLEQKEDKTEEEKEILTIERKKSLDIIRAFSKNKKFPPLIVPEKMITFSKLWKEERPKKFPPLFHIRNDFIMITQELYDLLQQFELGCTQLFPVEYYDLELEERFDNNTYYLLNVCEQQSYFMPEFDIEKIKKRLSYANIYHPPQNELQNKSYYRFSQDALNSPVDLWTDPHMRNCFFMSDRLVTAIKDTGMGEFLHILPCQFVE